MWEKDEDNFKVVKFHREIFNHIENKSKTFYRSRIVLMTHLIFFTFPAVNENKT